MAPLHKEIILKKQCAVTLRLTSVETGITNGGTNGAGSIADEDLPQFDDERELLGGDEDQPLEEEDEDGEELFGDNLEA